MVISNNNNNHSFQLVSVYEPSGDQPQAIKELTEGILNGEKYQVLLGVTGSGKTFTIANVIQNVNRPVLVISHNKTLAAQLFTEFKQFFPHNQVEFFISYYDYYQPEAYIPETDTYIEKDLAINKEIEKLRLRATAAILSGRRDVIIVASVSCIYGYGKPDEVANFVERIGLNQKMNRQKFLHRLVEMLYARSDLELKRGTFRPKGDTLDIFPAYEDFAIRISFWGDEVESLHIIEPETGKKIKAIENFVLFPASIFATPKNLLNKILAEIEKEMQERVQYFQSMGLMREARRIQERTEYDMEMIREIGFCKGIENYSRFFDQRPRGSRPYCLIDYFPKDYILVIDESHVTIPQIRAMYGGDRSRKLELVENGFRLPSALDNRPLKFEEFENLMGQTIFVSATPGEYELQKSGGVIVEQIVRPTGLLDPPVEVRPIHNQVDDLIGEIQKTVAQKERVLVTTLTKKMSEELAEYLVNLGINARYLHSEIDALERVEILQNLQLGKIDVLIGVNLLREGLDLPEVSLVAILDADKEGFLRSEKAFIQTAGRAARNVNGRVILYAERITGSMQKLIWETERRRKKQIEYNKLHNITPQPAKKNYETIETAPTVLNYLKIEKPVTPETEHNPELEKMSISELEQAIELYKIQMLAASAEENFLKAAKYRDEMFRLEKILKTKIQQQSPA
ncbi:MAG: excinuclease ABC subunit UvrB [Bacteroidia bacterium]|nr:excinuclease ABC subunit UvrB [Bacteroidia bacterium]MDW8158696.1 excinuclease ABC subunit UvrB [Bacteroidia bacterium]